GGSGTTRFRSFGARRAPRPWWRGADTVARAGGGEVSDRQTIDSGSAWRREQDRARGSEAAGKESVQRSAGANTRAACVSEGRKCLIGDRIMANEINNGIEPIQSPYCGSLRSKKFFLLDRLAASADDYIDGANHVWCCETQEVIGPDNRRVHPDSCG